MENLCVAIFLGVLTLPEEERKQASQESNAIPLLFFNFHFQSGHAFVTKKLLKAQLWGGLCAGAQLDSSPFPARTLFPTSNKRPFF